MHNVFGLDEESITVVTEDGAPTGSKDFVVWRTGSDDLDSQSSVKDAAALMRFLMKRGIRVILFCKVGHIYFDLTICCSSLVPSSFGKSANWYEPQALVRCLVDAEIFLKIGDEEPTCVP